MDDENWDDITGPGQPWGDGLTGTAGPGEDRGRDSGRSDVAGLDQLWDIGRTSGYGQAPDAAGQRTRDPGSAGDAGPAGSPGPARDSGPVRDGGPAREDGRSPEHGHSREKGSAWEGSAWESRPAREAGSSRDTTPESASAVSRDLPEDRAPNPLGAPGDRETADFLAAPPPTSSILTTAPRQEARTARPANVGDQGIAAELAGWAAGELPGQASARLAAWAAIGGVPADGYRRGDGSDVGAAGVGTERVR